MQQIQYERQLRGWSQADLAERLGCDARTIRRWEKGESSPTPYFRQQLVTLFDKNAKELGLLGDDYELPSPPVLDASPTPVNQPVPGLPFPSMKTSYRKIMGFLPPTDSRTIQPRKQAVQNIYRKLLQTDITALALTGMGGVGKSTLAALLYRFAEEQRQASQGPFLAEALWLTIDPAVTFADLMGNIFEIFEKPFPVLDNLAPPNQAVTLFNILNMADKPRLIVLDQFENLLSWDTGQALSERPGVGEWLDIINSQPCSCRILLTSRPRPVGTRKYPPTYLQEYSVQGLTLHEGVTLLQNQGVQGTEGELQTAVTRCAGHALSLTLLASLVYDHNIALATLFNGSTILTDDIATNLLDQIYQEQLSDRQRELLQAFSIYREPVPLEAVQVIVSHIPKKELLSALKALCIQHLLEKNAQKGYYQVHAIIADYTRESLKENGHTAKGEVLRVAHTNAAQYYLQMAIQNSTQDTREQISDIHSFVEALWHYCQAEEWLEAFHLMEQEGIFIDPYRWGRNVRLLELYQVMLDRWHPNKKQAALLYGNLGEIFKGWGPIERARDYLEQALQIYKEESNIIGQAKTLKDIGIIHYNSGKKDQALFFHKKALELFRETKDLHGEGIMLNYLGRTYSGLGQSEQAEKQYEQALSILRMLNDRREEGWTLYSLGRIYYSRGRKDQASIYFEEALNKLREIGDQEREGWVLISIGRIYEDTKEIYNAEKCYKRALDLLKNTGNYRGEARSLNNLGDVSNMIENSQEYYMQSIKIYKEIGDYGGEGWTLTNLGRTYVQQGNTEKALECYRQAFKIYQETEDLLGKARMLYYIGLFFLEKQNYEIAAACFLLVKSSTTVQNSLSVASQKLLEGMREEIISEDGFLTPNLDECIIIVKAWFKSSLNHCDNW